ncbi:MAG: Fic family protein [Gammaproteobacteria bacterium AqS3]|nr:Fic family protein [Gammaproteobacteria bacterium AqS3]
MSGWRPIEDCPDPRQLAHGELASLADVWKAQRGELEQQKVYHDFLERLKREWSIETGLIERLYTMDRGITEMLIEQGIKASLISHKNDPNSEQTAAMINSHKDAIDGLFGFVKSERDLSTGYIKELHVVLTEHQATATGVDLQGQKVDVELLKREYKKHPNNPTRPDGAVHHYCPPEQTASEMDRLIEMYQEYQNYPPEVLSAWLHHRFTQIHPFEDGNGRVARSLASLVFIKAGLFPLVVLNDNRSEYIEALERADAGDLKPLVDYFATLQRKACLKALSLSEKVTQKHQLNEAIQSAANKLRQRQDALVNEWSQAMSLAEALRIQAENRLDEVLDQLEEEMGENNESIRFYINSTEHGHDQDYFHRNQIIQVANKLDYFADLDHYKSWVCLSIKMDETGSDSNHTRLVISFHGFGHEFRGVLACSAVWYQRIKTEEGEQENMPAVSASDELFQINYRESPEDAKQRFADWLEAAIIRSINLWTHSSL